MSMRWTSLVPSPISRTGVAPVARDREVVHEAVAAEDLVAARALSTAVVLETRWRWPPALERLATQHPRGRVVVGGPGDVGACLHVGDDERERPGSPMGAPNASRVLAYFRSRRRRPGQPDGEGRDGDAPFVQGLQEVGVAPAAYAEQVVLGHDDVGVGDLVGVRSVPADLVGRRPNGDTVAGTGTRIVDSPGGRRPWCP